jgi:polyhydroxyalkanoate synthesis repressor PhaR
MAESAGKADPIIVKKYANRRLYNTDSSSYITLDHLAAMTREGREFKVVDAKSGDDITHQVLTQIIMEEESNGGQTLLPIPFLRQIISMYGDSMQSMVPHYLEASMEAFRANQTKFRDAMKGAFGGGAFAPFENLAKQNMAMFEAATNMFTQRPGVRPAETEAPRGGDDIATLREQMAALQAQLDRLDKR